MTAAAGGAEMVGPPAARPGTAVDGWAAASEMGAGVVGDILAVSARWGPVGRASG